MRVALVSTAFRTRGSFDLEAHVRSLAPALARAGAAVEVFAAMRGSGLAPHAQRRVEVLDHVQGATFGVSKMEVGDRLDPARIAAGFGAFLDRERPTVCHFESLDLFGTDVVHEARVRGIATVYCARDTWPAHDRTTLTLPDLSPFELGDADAEARVLVAEALMGPLPTDGTPPDEPAERDRLDALLHGDLSGADEVAAMRDARETIEVRRAEKRVALSAVDRRFAASRLLARQLSATVGRAFTFRAPGVDAFLLPDAPIAAVAAMGAAAPGGKPAKKQKAKKGQAPTSTVRFGFLGSTRPTGGVDVLMDAFATIRARMDAPSLELILGLERTDSLRDAALEERAERLGAKIQFHTGPVDAKALLARVDVLVFPSLWGEFEPTAVRIALASGRPVLASNMPGVAEAAPEDACVLVAPGDAGALEEALLDIASAAETYTRIQSGALSMRVESDALDTSAESSESSASAGFDPAADLPPHSDGTVKSVDVEAAEWLDTYRQLMGAARARTRIDRLAHVDDVAAQLGRLRELSVPELFERAQEGIGRLRRAFGVNDSDASLMARVVARGGAARDRAEQGAAAELELAQTLGDLHAAREAMRVEESARARRVGELHAVLGQYEQEALARGAEAARVAQDLATSRDEYEAETEAGREREVALETERDGLATDLAKVRERAAAAEAEIKAAQDRFEDMAEGAESARTALGEAESERDRLSRSVQEREDAVRALRDRVVDGSSDDDPSGTMLESIEAHCVALERDLETLRRHDAWLGDQTERLVALLEPVGRPSKDEDPSSDDILERSSRALEQLVQELHWRRGEMAAAREASESLRARLAGGPLASRVKSWSAGPPVITEPEVNTGGPHDGASDAPHGGPQDGASDETADITEEKEPDVEEPKAALPASADDSSTRDQKRRDRKSVIKTNSEDASSETTEETHR